MDGLKNFASGLGKKKLVSGLVALVMIFSFSVLPVKAMAATDAEILAMIQNILRVIEAIRNQITLQTVGAPVNLDRVEDKFTEPVQMGSTNNSVLLLHAVLGTDKALYTGTTVGSTFNAETADGLKNYQAKFKLPVTGTFTPETEYTLNAVLSTIAFATSSTDYLTKSEVMEVINQAGDKYLLENLVVTGKVVLRSYPVFSASVKSSDTATLQRIMRTDLDIFRGAITGLMDAETIQGVVKLRARYGLPFVFPPAGQSIDMTELIDDKTSALIESLLRVNNGPVIVAGLLTSAEAAPTLLVPNSGRTIESVRAVRNYIRTQTTVTIMYSGRVQETFVTDVFLPNQALINEIARKIDREASEFEDKMSYTELFAKEFKKVDVTFKVQKKEEVDLLVTYLDNTEKLFQTTKADEQKIIDEYYGGSTARFEAARDRYIEQARRGEVDNELYGFIANILNVSITEVRNKVTIKVIDDGSSDVPSGPDGGGE